MPQEIKPVASKEKHCGRQDEITPADDENEEIEIPQKKTLYYKVIQVMEKFASTRMGQMIIERTDRVLKVIEDTAKWSLPQDDKDVQLKRPLPWLFFLTLIVWLRGLRIGISVASFMVGSQRVTPESMVYYIQIKRRRLRAIRVNGLKAIHSREIESTIMHSGSSGENVTLIGKLRNLLGSAICKPGQHRDAPSRSVFVKDGKVQGSKDMAERSSKRPRDDDSVDLNLTVDQMLDKYANEDSDGDSDYVPKDDEDEDFVSTSCTSSSSDDTEKENTKEIDENPKETEKSAVSENDYKPLEEIEIKDNDGTKKPTMPKPMVEIKIEHSSDVDSGNEQVETPKETANTNGSDESRQPTESGAATEADHTHQQQISSNTPKSALNQLAGLQLEEDKQKSTPGHESAASLKPAISKTAAAVPTPLPYDIPQEKCYRTVTTQTSIEVDWSITFKTEISQIKRPPKLEIINCSIPLTPATSTEDIFYSPIGSPQDFHSIFHPAPIIKSSSPDAHSTPKEEHLHSENFTVETSEPFAANQKKYLHNLNHNKPYHHHHNAKNRNKNRR